MIRLKEDLKTRQFRKVYLLCGEETYLKKQYKDKLRQTIVGDDTMNYNYFEGKNVNPKEIIDLAETMPFFSEKRLIIMEDTGFFKSSAVELADYIKEMPDSTIIVFVESEIDKRSKLYKSVKECGYVAEMARQNEDTLLRWTAGLIKKEMRQMNDSTLRYFLNKVGSDMENIQKELEKLFCYTMGKTEITAKDVDAICITQITNEIFSMVDAVASKKQRLALDYYYNLLSLKEPPMRILFLLVRQFKILMEIKELDKNGYGKNDISTKAGVPPFAVRKYLDQAKLFSTIKLREIIEEGVLLEENVKTGKIGDVLAVELFIVKYSSK